MEWNGGRGGAERKLSQLKQYVMTCSKMSVIIIFSAAISLFDSNFQRLHNCGHRTKTLLYSRLRSTPNWRPTTAATTPTPMPMMQMVKPDETLIAHTQNPFGDGASMHRAIPTKNRAFVLTCRRCSRFTRTSSSSPCLFLTFSPCVPVNRHVLTLFYCFCCSCIARRTIQFSLQN